MENTKAPIFEYDDRYFIESKYTREELYKLQEIVLQQIKTNPSTYIYELKKIKDYDQKEIDTILTMLVNLKIEKRTKKS